MPKLTQSQREALRVQTPLARLSYPHLFKKAEPMTAGDTPKFQCELIFPESADLSKLEEALELAKSIWWPSRKGSVKWPIKDGDTRRDRETDEIRDGYEFSKFISPRSEDQPGVVIGPDRRTVTDPTEIYGGGYVIADLSAYGYEMQTGDGVTFALNNIWWIRGGEPFTSRRSAEEAFADTDVDDSMFEEDAYGGDDEGPAIDDDDLL